MKNILKLVLAIVAMSGSQAMAAEYQIYVTNSTHISATQGDLASIVQKDIHVDTTAKTLSINVSPVCTTQFCPHFVRLISLPVTKVQFQNGNLIAVTAQGNLSLNGSDVMTTLQITLNADNATNITISSGVAKSLDQSSFTGSPATKVAAQ